MKQNNPFNSMTLDELRTKVEELRHEFLSLRLSATMEHVKAFPSLKRQLRKNIARALTAERQKKQEIGS